MFFATAAFATLPPPHSPTRGSRSRHTHMSERSTQPPRHVPQLSLGLSLHIISLFKDLLFSSSSSLFQATPVACGPATMPPKGPDLDALPPEAVLPLHDWLKLISSRGVDMRVAMTLAAKM